MTYLPTRLCRNFRGMRRSRQSQPLFARRMRRKRALPSPRYEVALPMLDGAPGRIYVLEQDKAAVLAGEKAVEPLVLHVNVGDCILIELSNELETGPVSFHTDMLAVDPKQNLGVEAGYNPPQVVMPGESRLYTLYAHPEVGETVALVRDRGNVEENPGLGLYGAIVVGAGAAHTQTRLAG